MDERVQRTGQCQLKILILLLIVNKKPTIMFCIISRLSRFKQFLLNGTFGNQFMRRWQGLPLWFRLVALLSYPVQEFLSQLIQKV